MRRMPDSIFNSDQFRDDEAFARELDTADPLAARRADFHIPRSPAGDEAVYFCGNSLGLMPRRTHERVNQELKDWAELAVEGHFHGKTPWFPYHEFLRDSGARLVGALPHEVVFMNSLTVNLHLLMVSFYRPTRERFKILVEDCAFPSDNYAVRTQIRYHGFDPADALVVARPRDGEYTIRTDDLLKLIEREGPRCALIMLGGVNYWTGQVFEMPAIAAAGQAQGAIVGFDLAHAAGNIPLALHDWNVDFAAWCNYKYLNSGPGAIAGCFIHERHARNTSLPRFGGWWGNDPKTRFRMHLESEFAPVPTADAWQLSNPPIFSLAPVKSSLEIFDEVGMPALRAKSLQLTGYLQTWLDRLGSDRYQIITPREASARGCQISIFVKDRPRELFKQLEASGVVCDYREPNVVRVAPVPLYNSFHDVWRFARILASHV